MDIIIERGCGIDVHKRTVVACVMGKGIKKEVRTYSTMTNELIQLKEWLTAKDVSHVAIESTGVYWKPVFNILEECFEILLANARHVKNVPGRKTDVQDSEWLCKLLRNGLLRGSFIPPKPVRELRDLTRYKRKIIQTISSEKLRIQKVLEDANIKLSSIVSDTFGRSGRDIIDELIRGVLKVEDMVELSKGKLRRKKEELRDALEGNIQEHHRFMLKVSLEHIHAMEKVIFDIDCQIQENINDNYKTEYDLLQTIPGVKEKAGAIIIAEIGVNMNKFPTEAHLSSWAGMCPGNNVSAGKNKTGKTTHGSICLRSTLSECAWAASRTKGTYLQSKFHSLAGRRGRKRASVALGHKILIMCYKIIKHKVAYRELGMDYLDKRKKDKIIRSYVKRLSNLGYNVLIEEAA